MLVFTRKLDEAIIVGDGIEIKVLRIGRDGVRLGVSAPLRVPVHRREVYDQIRAANAAAAADPATLTAVVTNLRLPQAASKPEQSASPEAPAAPKPPTT